MLQKIIDFFSNLFASLFGGGTTTTETNTDTVVTPTPTPKPSPPITPKTEDKDKPKPIIIPNNFENLPSEMVDEEIAQDGADLASHSSSVEVINIPTPKPIEVLIPKDTDPIPTPSNVENPEPVAHKPRFLWCLDNGHGKRTLGKRSPVFDDGETQFLEYEFNRDIVKRIAEGLDAIGVKTFNVVPEVDIDNFLAGRVERANKFKSTLPKIYLSIHSNAGPVKDERKDWSEANGIETWFFKGNKRGEKLATIFQKNLIAFTGMKNRNIKATEELYVLRKTSMSAVLTENGFYNNKAEAAQLMLDDVRQQIADAHIAAILEIEEKGL